MNAKQKHPALGSEPMGEGAECAEAAQMVGLTADSAASDDELIRGWAELCVEVRKSRVQAWRDVKAGRLPAPIEIGPNSLAWYRREIRMWKASRPRRTYGAAEAA
jgi:predicted DNA-binding transcriptional regulator AlpA